MERSERTGARITPDLKCRIQEARVRRGMPEEQWIIEAVRAHLAGEGPVPADLDPLAHLGLENRRRVKRFIAFLEDAPEGLRRASDHGMKVLLAALAELKRGHDSAGIVREKSTSGD